MSEERTRPRSGYGGVFGTMKNVELFHGRVVKADEMVVALERVEGDSGDD